MTLSGAEGLKVGDQLSLADGRMKPIEFLVHAIERCPDMKDAYEIVGPVGRRLIVDGDLTAVFEADDLASWQRLRDTIGIDLGRCTHRKVLAVTRPGVGLVYGAAGEGR